MPSRMLFLAMLVCLFGAKADDNKTYVANQSSDSFHMRDVDAPVSPEDVDVKPPAVVTATDGLQEPAEDEVAGSASPRRRRSSSPRRRRSSSPRRRRACASHKHHIHMHVYTIMSKSADPGITNKNAADSLGDMSFIFGTRGYPEPRGVTDYYHDGLIVVNHVSLSSWGNYLQCNHPTGSTHYTCKCPTGKDYHDEKCHDLKRAGKVQNSHTGGHTWYSFPAAGKGTYWDYDHGSGCTSIEIEASCVIDALASHAGCPGVCAHDATKCVQCVNKMSDTEKQKVWEEAVWEDGRCPHSRRRRSKSTVNTSTVMWDEDELASMEVIV